MGTYVLKINSFLWLFGLLVVLTSLLTGDQALAATQTVILCVGDSITYGSGAPASQSYPNQLQGLLGSAYRVVNRGQPGWTADQVRDHLDAWLTEDQPDIVVVMVGVNDMRKKQKASLVRGEVQQIVDQAKTDGAKVILASVTPNLGDSKCDTVCMKALVNELRLKVNNEDYYTQGTWTLLLLDKSDITKGGNPLLFADALHPNAAGYKKIALVISAAIKALPGNSAPAPTPSPSPSSSSSPSSGCYEEDNSAISYTGSWIIGTHTKAGGGNWQFTQRAGSKSCLTFTGSSLDWYTITYKNRGSAKVYLDGKLIHTVSNYSSPGIKWQFIRPYNFAAGSHTFCVEAVGDGITDVDKFCVR
ncbi:MAG: GDSL-type esterase/lipase family protein [bacterium]